MDLNPCSWRGSKFCGPALFCLLGWAACSPPKPAVLRDDARQALADGALARAPVLLLYAAPWCQACRALADLVQSPQMAGALAHVVVVRVELGDDLQALQPLPAELRPEALGITSVPTLVYLGDLPRLGPAPGSVLQGYVGRKRLSDWLKGRK